jgi:hypothetical protein
MSSTQRASYWQPDVVGFKDIGLGLLSRHRRRSRFFVLVGWGFWYLADQFPSPAFRPPSYLSRPIFGISIGGQP